MQFSELKQALRHVFRRQIDVHPRDRERLEADFGELLLYLVSTADRFGVDLLANARQAQRPGPPVQPKAVGDFSPFVAGAATAANHPPRILIVEDEGIIANDLREMLNGLGYDAFAIAASGAKAMAIARHMRPDIALMDIRIDGPVDGIDVSIQLHQQFDTAVVFVTALGNDATVQRAQQAEPYAYLIKPVSDSALKAAIELTAQRRRLSR
jgi:CheY-like chemotaxis protein